MVAEIFKNEETLFLKGYLKGLNLNEAIRAVNIAEEYHGGVYRKSGELYISHPIRIASALISLGIKDSEILVGAILHDVLEDTSITEEVLFSEFSEEAVDIIIRVTNKPDMSKEEYYNQIAKNPKATVVKLADRCHNVSTMNHFNLNKIKKYIKETEDYVLPLCSIVSNRFPEWSNEIYYMKYHIESIMEMTKGIISMYEN